MLIMPTQIFYSIYFVAHILRHAGLELAQYLGGFRFEFDYCSQLHLPTIVILYDYLCNLITNSSNDGGHKFLSVVLSCGSFDMGLCCPG